MPHGRTLSRLHFTTSDHHLRHHLTFCREQHRGSTATRQHLFRKGTIFGPLTRHRMVSPHSLIPIESRRFCCTQEVPTFLRHAIRRIPQLTVVATNQEHVLVTNGLERGTNRCHRRIFERLPLPVTIKILRVTPTLVVRHRLTIFSDDRTAIHHKRQGLLVTILNCRHSLFASRTRKCRQFAPRPFAILTRQREDAVGQFTIQTAASKDCATIPRCRCRHRERPVREIRKSLLRTVSLQQEGLCRCTLSRHAAHAEQTQVRRHGRTQIHHHRRAFCHARGKLTNRRPRLGLHIIRRNRLRIRLRIRIGRTTRHDERLPHQACIRTGHRFRCLRNRLPLHFQRSSTQKRRHTKCRRR